MDSINLQIRPGRLLPPMQLQRYTQRASAPGRLEHVIPTVGELALNGSWRMYVFTNCSVWEGFKEFVQAFRTTHWTDYKKKGNHERTFMNAYLISRACPHSDQHQPDPN